MLKWAVVAYAGGRVRAQAKFKSSAMDKALTLARKTGLRMVVAEVRRGSGGKPALYHSWDTGAPASHPENYQKNGSGCGECRYKGWVVIESGSRGPEIQRCDNCQKFKSDAAARRAAPKGAKTRVKSLQRAWRASF